MLARAAGLQTAGAAAVLESLAADGEVEVRAGGYVRAGSGAAGPDPLAQGLLRLLKADGLEPRAVEALAAQAQVSAAEAARALDGLAAAGDVARVKPGLYYHPLGLEQAQVAAVSICEREGAVTIAGLRDRLGTSRKYAQALLEHFDAVRVARRVGDQHVLRRSG